MIRDLEHSPGKSGDPSTRPSEGLAQDDRLIRPPDGRASIEGRNYVPADIPIIVSAGPAAGFLAVLVFALYINTPTILAYYPRHEILWGICLVLVYWIMRIWFLAARNQMHDDPVLFAVKDKTSLVAGMIVVVLLLAARHG